MARPLVIWPKGNEVREEDVDRLNFLRLAVYVVVLLALFAVVPWLLGTL